MTACPRFPTRLNHCVDRVTHHVPVAFGSVVFNRKSTRVAGRVGAASLSTDGRKARKHGSAFSDGGEKVGLAYGRDVMLQNNCTIAGTRLYTTRQSLTVTSK